MRGWLVRNKKPSKESMTLMGQYMSGDQRPVDNGHGLFGALPGAQIIETRGDVVFKNGAVYTG